MKVLYDSHTDTLSVILKDNVAVHESDEDKPGVILDYDKEGNLISLEILDASKRSRIPATLIFNWLNDQWIPRKSWGQSELLFKISASFASLSGRCGLNMQERTTTSPHGEMSARRSFATTPTGRNFCEEPARGQAVVS